MNNLLSEFLQTLIIERLESEEPLRPNIVLIKIVDNATMARKYRHLLPINFSEIKNYEECKPYMPILAKAAIANYDCEMLCMILEFAIGWTESPEGINFWDLVYRSLRLQKPNPVLVELCPLSYLSLAG